MTDWLAAQITARLAIRNQRGASAVEYGLLVAGVVLALALISKEMGLTLRDTFGRSVSNVDCHC